MRPNYEWNAQKAKFNYQKHGIDFEEAITVFRDHHSITIFDPDHSAMEQRFIDIGLSERGRVLVVIYTERRNRIRIISARRATLAEQRRYDQGDTE
jgi:uncharacterized DUF497 family protein